MVPLETCWSDEGTFCDPLIPDLVQSRKQVNDTIGEMRAKYVRPGQRFVRLTEIQEHHHVSRYVWGLLDENGREVRRGEDVIARASDGRIAELLMFFGVLEELGSPV